MAAKHEMDNDIGMGSPKSLLKRPSGEGTFAPVPFLLTFLMEIHRNFHSQREEQTATVD